MAEVIQINKDTWRIEDGMVRMFLFCGEEKAALIDTGMNVPDAKQIAQGITALPLVLINTHADPDHISGNAAFDQAYMGAAEEENYRAFGATGKIVPLHKGDIIELGGRPLKIIDLPGHTKGSIAILDEKNRVLVGGDSIQDGNIFMFGPQRNLTTYIQSLKNLSAYDGLFDEVYAMHGSFSVSPSIIPKLIQGAQAILDGKATGTPVDMFGNKVNLYKFDYAGFFYSN